jgi:hypothetical protein
MRRSLASFALVLLAHILACGGDSGPPPPRVEPPAAPAANDPAFRVERVRDWYLVGNAATPGHDTVEVQVFAPEGTEYVDIWVAGRPGQRLSDLDDSFGTVVDIATVPVGTHDLLLAADGATTAFARLPLRRSHPYYVLMSTDWDFSDPSQQALDRHDTFHAQHPDLVITHFPGPYTFTDPALPQPRKDELAAWLRRMRDEHGDEIGLHIHPYCHFVEHAGLTCITDQSTVYVDDPSGYTVKVSAYGEAGFGTLLDAADALFVANDLGKPTTFRAGGWTASIETLRALASRGYVADTSANNWARMEEWQGQGTGELYRWNMMNWMPIDDTSQPYYPNMDDVLSSADPTLSILEVPDNGIMVDYVSTAEMVEIFAANWNGTDPLLAPTVLMVGFHPADGFSDAEHQRVDGILDHTDQFLALHDRGPVVYTTLNQLPLAFPR